MPNTKEKPLVNWHFTCQLTHLYENVEASDISEVYKVQAECLKDSECNSYDENDMKEKGKWLG